MKQQERILAYIDEFGSITPMEAFADLGVTKLATRVSEMQKMGIRFDKEMMCTRNRYGEKVHYMRYKRAKGGDER